MVQDQKGAQRGCRAKAGSAFRSQERGVSKSISICGFAGAERETWDTCKKRAFIRAPDGLLGRRRQRRRRSPRSTHSTFTTVRGSGGLKTDWEPTCYTGPAYVLPSSIHSQLILCRIPGYAPAPYTWVPQPVLPPTMPGFARFSTPETITN